MKIMNYSKILICTIWMFSLSQNIAGQIKTAPMLKMDTTAQSLVIGVKTLETLQKGGRSRESISEVVKLKLQILKNIYDKRLMEKPDLEGRIKTKFKIDEFGKVVYSEIVESSVGDSVLESELLKEINSWVFHKIDKPGDITEVIYPFVFNKNATLPIFLTITGIFVLAISCIIITQMGK